MSERAFTTRQVGRFCGVDLTTVINWVKSGKLSAYKTMGGHRRITASALKEFMERFNIPLPKELEALESREILFLVADPGDPEVQVKTVAEKLAGMGYVTNYIADDLEGGYAVASRKPLLIIVCMPAKDDLSDRIIRRLERLNISSLVAVVTDRPLPENRQGDRTQVIHIEKPLSACKIETLIKTV